MLLTCPHCSGQSEIGSEHAGGVASCPHCALSFGIPRHAALIPVASRQTLIVDPPPPPVDFPSQSTPQIVVVHAPSRSQPRLRASGWFARSFASTSGVLLAVFLFVIGVPIAICGGALCLSAYQRVREAQQKTHQEKLNESIHDAP